jgi:hypothetical protein
LKEPRDASPWMSNSLDGFALVLRQSEAAKVIRLLALNASRFSGFSRDMQNMFML